jgi:hypothetical protein
MTGSEWRCCVESILAVAVAVWASIEGWWLLMTLASVAYVFAGIALMRMRGWLR